MSNRRTPVLFSAIKDTYRYLMEQGLKLHGRESKEKCLATIRCHYGEEIYHNYILGERWPHYPNEFHLSLKEEDRVPLTKAAFMPHNREDEKDNPEQYVDFGPNCAGWGLPDKNPELNDYYSIIRAKQNYRDFVDNANRVFNQDLAYSEMQKERHKLENKYPGLLLLLSRLGEK